MCKDFVIMFGMSQSILLDKGKDVIIILKNESEERKRKIFTCSETSCCLFKI
jgi:hypothetical protein